MSTEKIADFINKIRSNPDSVIGQHENEWLDFKSEPYWTNDVNQQQGKIELARDVASFANANGGLIVIGGKTRKCPTRQLDILDELNGISLNGIDTRSMSDTLKEYLYPEIPGIEINTIPLKENYCAVTILIPDAGLLRKPVFVRKDNSFGKRINQTFSLSTRYRDSTSNHKIETIHSEIQFGRHITMLLQSLASGSDFDSPLLSQYFKGLKGSEVHEISKDKLDEEIAKIQNSNGIKNEPSFVLQAAPIKAIQLRGLHNIEKGDFRIFRSGFPKHRENGFNWETYTDPEKFDDGSVGCHFGDGEVRLNTDGIVTAVVLIGDGDTRISWGMKKQQINQLALVEMILDFVHRYEEICLSNEVTDYYIRCFLYNILGVSLCSRKLDKFNFANTNQSSQNTIMYDVNGKFGSAPSVAYCIAEHIFLEFGFSQVPYSKDNQIVVESI